MKFTETTKNGKPVYKLDGKVVSKREFNRAWAAAARRMPKVKKRKALAPVKRGYPYEGLALACHPSQVQEQMERMKKLGVPTEYRPNGSPVMRDAGHRRAFLKANGAHDRNSYSGY